MSEQNKAQIRRVIEEVYNRGDLAVVDEVAASDLVIHAVVPGHSRARRGQAIRRRVAQRRFRTSISPSRTRLPKATWW